MIYQEKYDELIHLGKQIVTHRQQIAKERIESLVLDHLDPSVANDALLTHLVSESLLKRIDRQLVESKNIYVQEFDIPQTELFYSMAQAVPLVSIGHSLANQCIESAVSGFEQVTVLDIGVGRGQQMGRLIQALEEKPESPRRISIIGLDPVQQNLDDSAQLFRRLGADVNIDLEFHPICKMVETLDDKDFDLISSLSADVLAINSAFSFHHTSHPLGDNDFRTALLRKIAGLNPAIVTLVEPNSNHDTEYLPLRIHNAWLHFGSVFALIDESDIDPSHKFLIKEKFFGREIRDIFGVSDHFRCERHELYEDWLMRLHRAGFVPYERDGLRVDLPGYCTHESSDGVVRLDYSGTTIVAILSFTLKKFKI